MDFTGDSPSIRAQIAAQCLDCTPPGSYCLQVRTPFVSRARSVSNPAQFFAFAGNKSIISLLMPGYCVSLVSATYVKGLVQDSVVIPCTSNLAAQWAFNNREGHIASFASVVKGPVGGCLQTTAQAVTSDITVCL